MLLFEKNQITLKAFYQDADLIIQPFKCSKERMEYAQSVASSEEALARIYLRTNLRAVTTDDVKNHFLIRGWRYVKSIFK
jgi:hypothetical protein